jgi:cytochrome c biogenesis protein CcmG/thiol:disulfide interchange protein DsbE
MAAGVTAADDAATGAAGKPRRRRFLIAAGLAGVVAVIAVAVGSALWSAHGDPGATLSGSPLIGRPAPPLAGATVTGGHTSLASYRGRWVVVNFFASWCVPCQQETPELARFAAAHPGPGDPAVLGVVYQDDDGSVRDFIRHHRVTWPLLSYAGIDTANAYGVAGIPVTFLVAPDGRISAKILGGLRAGQLDTLVAQAERDSAGQTATTTRTTGS